MAKMGHLMRRSPRKREAPTPFCMALPVSTDRLRSAMLCGQLRTVLMSALGHSRRFWHVRVMSG